MGACQAAPTIARSDEACSVAVCFSGQIRSFADQRISSRTVNLLIDPLRASCGQVDTFLYVSLDDVAPDRSSGPASERAFTAYEPPKALAEAALALLEPTAVVYHQDQAGEIPNSCNHQPTPNAFWQLYKMQACWRMVERHERGTARGGRPYKWVIRTRFDLGWLAPLPPLAAFPPTRIWMDHDHFPVTDQFAVVPRPLAPAFMEAVSQCYNCSSFEAPWRLPHLVGETEMLLYRALEVGRAPHGAVDLPFVIARHQEGGVCQSLYPRKLVCHVLQAGGRINAPWEGTACQSLFREWAVRRCRALFPGSAGDANMTGADLDAAREAAAFAERFLALGRSIDISADGGSGGVSGGSSAVYRGTNLPDSWCQEPEETFAAAADHQPEEPAVFHLAQHASAGAGADRLHLFTRHEVTSGQLNRLARALRCELLQLQRMAAAAAAAAAGGSLAQRLPSGGGDSDGGRRGGQELCAKNDAAAEGGESASPVGTTCGDSEDATLLAGADTAALRVHRAWVDIAAKGSEDVGVCHGDVNACWEEFGL